MLSLSAYKIADLQLVRGVLTVAIGGGMTLSDLDAQVAAAIAKGTADRPPQRKAPVPEPLPPCPRCSKGVIEYWGHSSRQTGARVMGCRSCHYSYIEETHHGS